MTGTLTAPRTFDAHRRRVVLIAARFNHVLVDQLIAGARQAWREHAFELPLAAKMFAASGGVDAVVALGCVIRGDTPHFDYVAGECARGLLDAGLSTGVPVIFGVLTTENQAQAEERADVTRMNKGRESLEAALEMIHLLAPPAREAKTVRKPARNKPSRKKGSR
jgi:6,7-dimethyl-8-ribityllumazine synthase